MYARGMIQIEQRVARDKILSVRQSKDEKERMERAARRVKTKPAIFARYAIAKVADEILLQGKGKA